MACWRYGTREAIEMRVEAVGPGLSVTSLTCSHACAAARWRVRVRICAASAPAPGPTPASASAARKRRWWTWSAYRAAKRHGREKQWIYGASFIAAGGGRRGQRVGLRRLGPPHRPGDSDAPETGLAATAVASDGGTCSDDGGREGTHGDCEEQRQASDGIAARWRQASILGTGGMGVYRGPEAGEYTGDQRQARTCSAAPLGRILRRRARAAFPVLTATRIDSDRLG